MANLTAAEDKRDDLRDSKDAVTRDLNKEEANKRIVTAEIKTLKKEADSLQDDYDEWMEKENPYEKYRRNVELP